MNVWEIDATQIRTATQRADPLFVGRWSPRAMTGAPLDRDQLLPLFEAARWAPSAANFQPWRFVFAVNGDEHWEELFGLLTERNQMWCARAGALVVVISRNRGEENGRPARTHSFDTGAAWMSIALQARLSGLVAHGMAGFDVDQTRMLLALGEEYTVEAMIALGVPGEVEDLPESYRERETPSGRRPLEEILFHGRLA